MNLLVDRLSLPNVIIVNKASLLDKDELEQVISVIKGLNLTARLRITDYAQVELKEILNTGLFDYDEASRSPLWAKELNGEICS